MNIKDIKNKLNKLSVILLTLPILGGVGGSFLLTSCSSMLTPDSDLVEFEDDNKLDNVQDTLYSVMGIIKKMQVIADRTVLLGEVRGDLLQTKAKATTSIKELADFEVSDDNEYNNIADYYAVINSCNYYLDNVNADLHRLGDPVFEREIAVVKTYRAWTYLQLAKIYGKVPFVTSAITAIDQAEAAQNMEYSDMKQICDYFINELTPLVETLQPNYGTIYGTYNSQKYFIPVRVLLGEMCLWTDRYEQAAQFFFDYLTYRDNCKPTKTNSVQWASNIIDEFSTGSPRPWDSYFNSLVDELISVIPMETSEYNGLISHINDVYSSTRNNNYYAQVVPSAAMKSLSRAQQYCQVNNLPGSATQKDTVNIVYDGNKGINFVDRDGTIRKSFPSISKEDYAGDLRFCANYSYNQVNRDIHSPYSSDVDEIAKFSSSGYSVSIVPIYRVQQIYLMFAEALNRAGYPETAFAILKYGIGQDIIEKHPKWISEREQERAKKYLAFNINANSPKNNFDVNNTQGIHSRGCGDVWADSLYILPQPEVELASFEDTLQYQIPLVEKYILDEMALEEAFEGHRFYNLMRIAIRRNDESILAKPVSNRTGVENAALYQKLMDRQNWYLQIKK